MHKLALIGQNISHSRSQEMYQSILKEEVDYTLLDITDPHQLDLLALFEKYEGISITAPYKKSYLESVFLTDEIKQLGAINCLRKINQRIEATNTDYLAIEKKLKYYVEQYESLEFVILGDGAMSFVTLKALEKLQLKAKIVARSNHLLYVDVDLGNFFEIADAKHIVINACSRNFIFQGNIEPDVIFWDYNYALLDHYNYLDSKCCYIDGAELLKSQAAYALEFWDIL